MRLRRPMTEMPYEFDIDHPGRASGYPVWASITLPRSSPRTWPAGRDLDSGVTYRLPIIDFSSYVLYFVRYTAKKQVPVGLYPVAFFFFEAFMIFNDPS